MRIPRRSRSKLGDDLVEMREWLHGFAESVIRPAAAEWGRAGGNPVGRSWRRPPRSVFTRWTSTRSSTSRDPGWVSRSRFEELFWGDAGGSGWRWPAARWPPSPWWPTGRRSRSGSGARRCSAARGEVKLGAFCSSEPEAGSDVGRDQDPRGLRTATADAWVLNGVKTWATNGGHRETCTWSWRQWILSSERGGRPALSCRRAHTDCLWGRSFRKHGIRALAHRRGSCCPTSGYPASALVGGPGPARPAAGPGPRGRSRWRAGRHEDVRVVPGPGWRRWRSAVARAAVGVRDGVRRGPGFSSVVRWGQNQAVAFMLADMRAAVDAARPADVARPPGWARQGKPLASAEGSMSKLVAGETAVRVTEQAIQILGGKRVHARLPGRAVAPRRQDLHDLRGYLRDPAHDHRPRRHRPGCAIVLTCEKLPFFNPRRMTVRSPEHVQTPGRLAWCSVHCSVSIRGVIVRRSAVRSGLCPRGLQAWSETVAPACPGPRDGAYRSEASGGVKQRRVRVCSAAGRLVLPAVNQASFAELGVACLVKGDRRLLVATSADPGSCRVRRDNCDRNWTQAHASGYSGKEYLESGMRSFRAADGKLTTR